MRLSMRRGSVLVLVVALSSGCPPKQKPPTAGGAAGPEPEVVAAPVRTPEDRLQEALGLLARRGDGDAALAVSLLEEVLRERPDWLIARYNLGVGKFQLGEWRDAIRAFEDVLDADPKMTAAWASIARCHEAAGRADKALLTWRDAVEAAPSDLDVRVGLVAALRTQGRHQDAIQAAKDALGVNTNSLAIYDEMGQAYLALGELTLAEFVFDKARVVFKEAEQHPPLLTHLAWTWQRKKNLPEAVYFLEKALSIDASYVPALTTLSQIRMDQHDWAGAVSLLESAEKLVPNDAGLHQDLGLALRGLGRFDDAERHYRRALELAPENPAPWFNLGILFGDYQKRYPDAIAALQKYVDARGPQAATAEEYISDLEKEQKKAEKRRKQEEERKAREAERLRLQQAAEAEQAAQAAQAAQAEAPTATPAETTTPEGVSSPEAPPIPAPEAPPGEPAEGAEAPSSPWDTPVGNGG